MAREPRQWLRWSAVVLLMVRSDGATTFTPAPPASFLASPTASPTVMPTSAFITPAPPDAGASVAALPCSDKICLDQAQINVGSVVEIQNLASAPQFNGQQGTIVAANAQTSTYQVQLMGSAQTVPGANLELMPGAKGGEMCGPSGVCRSCAPCSHYATSTLMPKTTTAAADATAAAEAAAAIAVKAPSATACMAPQVANSEGISCDQGLWVPSGQTCTPDCGDGYYASLEALTCFNGTLSPATFECHDWYNRTQNLVLIAMGGVCCLVTFTVLILAPFLMRKNYDGATTRTRPPLTESRPIDSQNTDEVSAHDFKNYSQQLAQKLSKGYEEIKQKILWFMELRGQPLRDNDSTKSDFQPFEFRTGRNDITELERIIIDISIRKRGNTYSVTHKSRTSTLTGPASDMRVGSMSSAYSSGPQRDERGNFGSYGGPGGVRDPYLDARGQVGTDRYGGDYYNDDRPNSQSPLITNPSRGLDQYDDRARNY